MCEAKETCTRRPRYRVASSVTIEACNAHLATAVHQAADAGGKGRCIVTPIMSETDYDRRIQEEGR